MSRQNKAVRTAATAAHFTALHKSGQRGPARTTPKRNNKARQSNSPDRMLARLKILADVRTAVMRGR